MEGLRLRSRIRWNLKGDWVTKEFFCGVKEKAASSTITCLRDHDGNRITEQAGMKRLCHNFYRDLYTTGPQAEAHEAAMQAFLDLIPRKFTAEAQVALSQPLSN
jgi:hypothetical protein